MSYNYLPSNTHGFATYPQPGYTQIYGQPPAAQPQGFNVRPVTSREEAVAAQIDFMGPGTIMPDFGHGVIFYKKFNPNTGSSELLEYALKSSSEPTYATIEDLAALREELLAANRQPKGGGKKIVADD